MDSYTVRTNYYDKVSMNTCNNVFSSFLAAWTSLPGVPMENDDGTRKILSVPGNRMKFVVTNGLGKFDTPNPYGDPHKPKNYEINEPGCYILEAGNLRRL